jgi:phosphoadenosine phosphosulfate reductase
MTTVNTQLLEKKVADSRKVILDAFAKYPVDKLRVAFTGGKDSTLVLWLIREAVKETKHAVPGCFCIDDGDMFDEVRDFIKERERDWGVKVDMIHNHDVSSRAPGGLGSEVKIADLNERNRKEVARLGYEDETFTYEPESYVGNHLMNTATCMVYVEQNKLEGFFEGIRWDEPGAKANEKYFSPHPATDFNAAYVRINPILHFTERDVWDAIKHFNIPTCRLYGQGYRSLGPRATTRKTSDAPAWEQDLENTTERGGKRQDKERMMARLRSLGYM